MGGYGVKEAMVKRDKEIKIKTGGFSAVKLEKLGYSYPHSETRALEDVTLELEKGELVLLTGPSGCGKSTLVRCLNRLIPEVSGGELFGSVMLFGKDISREKVHSLALDVGMVFQNPETQLFSLTVGEDLAFGPENLGLPIPDVKTRVETALKTVGLEALRDHFIFTLSGGEKQRTAIGGNLALNPGLLVLDEPTSDLDPQGTAEVLEVLRKLNSEEKVTIILIEHKLDAVYELSDRMLVMDGGQLVFDGKPYELFCRETSKLRDLGVQSPQLIELALLLGLNSERDSLFVPPSYETLLTRLARTLNAGNREGIGIGSEVTRPGGNMSEDIIFRKNSKAESPLHVKLEGLSCRQEDGTLTLKALNLKIRQGEFLALLGHNGAGKSTLAGHLIGFYRPTEGRVLLKGQDISSFSTAELARQVGYLFQNPDSQIFTDSVFEEVRFGLETQGLPEAEITERANSALKLMELWPYRTRHPHALSRGQRQRLAVASILALEPDLLVLDEPTTGQDRGHVHKFLEKIRDLNRQGKTVIIITHDMELAAEYAERIVVLKNGEILLDGPKAEVFSNVGGLEAAGLTPPLPARICLDLQKRGVEIPLLPTLKGLKQYLRGRCPGLPEVEVEESV